MSSFHHSNQPEPQSVDMEMCVLGAIMLEPREAPALVAPLLTDRDFYLEGHALLYRVMLEMAAAGIPPESAAVLSRLRESDRLAQVGGSGVIMGMLNSVPTAANLDIHARRVLEYSRRRALIRVCRAAEGQCFAGELATDEVIAALATGIAGISRRGTDEREVRPLQEVAREHGETLIQRLDEAQRQGYSAMSQLAGPATGFTRLDEASGGYCPGDLWIIAARPNTGKTRITLTSLGIAAREGATVGLISLDMSGERLLKYIVPVLANVNGQDVLPEQVYRPYGWDEMAAARVRDVCRAADPCGRFWLIDSPRGRSIDAIQSHCRALADKGCKVVAVDQTQNILGWARGAVDRGEYSRIMDGMKEAARRYGICLIQLHQIQREGAGMPQMIHLKDSGNLEEFSDFILIFHDVQRAYVDMRGGFVWDEKSKRIRQPRETDPESAIIRQVDRTRPIRFNLAKSRAGETAIFTQHYDFARGVPADAPPPPQMHLKRNSAETD